MPTSARQSVPLFAKIFGEFAAVKQADDSVRPQNARLFSEILGEFVTSQRADVGIGPYRTPANPYCLTNFKRKADLPQQFKRSDLQIWCTVTGCAYHSASKVSMCVRKD